MQERISGCSSGHAHSKFLQQIVRNYLTKNKNLNHSIDEVLLHVLAAKGRSVVFVGIVKRLLGKRKTVLYSPMMGKTVPITQVPDAVFAEGMLGNGIAIEPTDGSVFAPCDAQIDMIFETGHAVSMIADCGAQILIHVGLETVKLSGKPFKAHAKAGERVGKGQLLIEADLDAIRSAGLPSITPLVVCNTDAYTTFKTYAGKVVTSTDVVIELTQ